jgi:uncharacterized protein YdgA (DUF945 family)
MKKRTVWIAAATAFLAIAAVSLAGPYVSGRVAEDRFAQSIEALEQDMNLKVEVLEYERSWFTASAATKLELDPETTVTLVHDISHGPTPLNPRGATVVTTIDFPESARKTLDYYFPDAEALQVVSRVGLTGSQSHEAVIPAFSGEVKDRPGVSMEWEQAFVAVEMNAGQDRMRLQGEAPLFRVHGEDTPEVVLSGYDFTTEVSKSKTGLWPGKGGFSLNRFALVHPGDEARLEVRGVKTDVVSSEEQGLFSANLGTRLDLLEVGGRTYTDGLLEARMSRLDAEAVAELDERVSKRMKQDPSPEEINTAVAAILGELLPRFLDDNPEMAVETLEVETPDGRIIGTLALRYAGASEPGQPGFTPLLGLEGRAELAMPRSAALKVSTLLLNDYFKAQLANLPEQERQRRLDEAAARQLQGLERQGLVVVEDGVYRVRAELDQASLTVNGIPIL